MKPAGYKQSRAGSTHNHCQSVAYESALYSRVPPYLKLSRLALTKVSLFRFLGPSPKSLFSTKSNAKHNVYVAQYLPGYDRKKELDRHKGKITIQSIQHAIKVASKSPLSSFDSTCPGSDVWRLVQAILAGQ